MNNTKLSNDELIRKLNSLRDTILNDDIKFVELQELISNSSKLIKKIDLVDVYKGSQIDNTKKSYSISVTLEEKKKTLDEIEINRISEKIIKNVNKELNGEIRS